jgi:hypothetical protein
VGGTPSPASLPTIGFLLAESADGFAWAIRSVIADENCKLDGNNGPCEGAICRLKDGRLMCVFRLGNGFWL